MIKINKMNCLKLIFILILSSGVISCATSEPPELLIEEDEWVYEIRAINLVARASSDLNSVRGRPHSLALGIFQMNDPNTFRGLSVSQTGAVELLQKGQIDESIVNFQQITIRPGEQKKVSINRAQTAKYIGVIAGYFKLNPKTDVHIFPIPLRPIKRGMVESALAFAALITDESKAIPGKLNVFVDLGRTGSKQIISVEDPLIAQQNTDSNSTLKTQQSWFESLNDKKNISRPDSEIEKK
ncbi:MAG: type VI secretion system lipoprotein TssJ [Gammaproteobacteria bacterium]|nr:type VI secretion system lipoprotein TssJ [Gammaproteobacteria bacterium]